MEWGNDLDAPFTMEELHGALAHVNTKSSPGMDLIDYIIIKNLPPLAKHTLLRIYNMILRTGVFPLDWRKFRVFFIPKSGGKGFRPISLSSCVCKVMERMISLRLVWWLEKNNIFPKSQYEFRSQKSCIDNLAIFSSEIFLAFLKGCTAAAALLDIQSAYDNVLGDLLLDTLSRLGVSPGIMAFIQNIMSFRLVQCQLRENIINVSAFKGLPQGSVLSPILYNLYVLKIEDCCSPGIRILQYADDIGIYSIDPEPKDGILKLEISITNINACLADIGLSLARKKTQFIVFSKNNRATRAPVRQNHRRIFYQLNSAGCKITNTATVKFLGVTFQSDLNWTQHTGCLIKNCSFSMRTLRCLGHTWWGAQPGTLLILFKALIRSRLEYATFLLHKAQRDVFAAKADKIQLQALRIAMGYPNSIPINVIFAESKIPPMKVRNLFLCRNFLTKAFCASQHPLLPLLSEAAELANCLTTMDKRGVPLLVKVFEELEKKSHLLPE